MRGLCTLLATLILLARSDGVSAKGVEIRTGRDTLEGPYDIAHENATDAVSVRASDAAAESRIKAILGNQTGNGLTFEAFKYYSTLYTIPDFSGKMPDLVLHIPDISFELTLAPFYPFSDYSQTLPSTHFGLRGTEFVKYWAGRAYGRLLVTMSASHIFYLIADEGARLSINGALIVQNNGENVRNGVQHSWGQVYLKRGWHDLLVEYFQNEGTQELTLAYTYPNQTVPMIVPTSRLFMANHSCAGVSRRAYPAGAAAVGAWGPGEVAAPSTPEGQGSVCWGTPILPASPPDGLARSGTCKEPCDDLGSAFANEQGAGG